jgi:hypothetical protein
MTAEMALEARVRRLARRKEYVLHKRRGSAASYLALPYYLVDPWMNTIFEREGWRFEANKGGQGVGPEWSGPGRHGDPVPSPVVPTSARRLGR